MFYTAGLVLAQITTKPPNVGYNDNQMKTEPHNFSGLCSLQCDLWVMQCNFINTYKKHTHLKILLNF